MNTRLTTISRILKRSGALAVCSAAMGAAAPFVDDFAAGSGKWEFLHPAMWSVEQGRLRAAPARGMDSHAFANMPRAADLVIETEVRVLPGSARRNFGVVLRAADHEERLVLRYYDQPEALELLAFHDDGWRRLGERSERIAVASGEWHTLKLAAVGPVVAAKLWPTGRPEPAWQVHCRVDAVAAGRAGLEVHDEGVFEFRRFSLATEAPAIREIRKQLEAERQAALDRLRTSLRLAVAPREFPEADGETRIIEIVPFAESDRVPLNGTLRWTFGGTTRQSAVTEQDYQDGAVVISVSEPASPTVIEASFTTEDNIVVRDTAILKPGRLKPWRHYVEESIETLITHGRDDYGPQKTSLIMAVLDTATRRSPREPQRLDAIVRLEGRIHRRGERGSNLWYDQGLLNAMDRLSELTGKPKYAQAADEYIGHFLRHCRKADDDAHVFHTGLPAWGSHVYWDCYEERPAGDLGGSGPHEILVFRAEWERMHKVAPEAVRRLADGVWEHHIVDKTTGRHNRHDDGQAGCDFAFSGSSFLHLFAAMAGLTGEQHYLDKARTVAGWHWNNRNKQTGLPADCPGLTGRYDGNHTFTTVGGPHAMALLEAGRVTGDEFFTRAATTYIKAYDKHAWDAQAEAHYAMLTLDGTPLPDREKADGYGAYAPYGHVNVWRTTFFSYEFALSAAQAAILAYEVSGADAESRDPALLEVAKRWATDIEAAMPPHTGRRWKEELEAAMPLARATGGAYAEDYGRAISFFVHLHRATGERHHLELANRLAEDAVRKLFHNGLFKGHPAKPYYETTNGVGLLLYALLELDSPKEPLKGAY